jgi:hypothetical protein
MNVQGNTEQHQITLIAQLCGTITTEVWEGVDRLELFNKMDIPKVGLLATGIGTLQPNFAICLVPIPMPKRNR